MSDTRQVWKPWRANTRTAASRICRRLSTAARVAATTRDLGRPAVRGRPPVGQRRQRRGGSRPGASRSRSATTNVSRVGRLARARRPRGRRSSSARRSGSPGACSPTWLAATTKHWSSIARARSRTSQCSRVVGEREGGRDDAARGRRGRRAIAVELGEAQVVTDAQAQLDAVRGRGDARPRRPAPRARTRGRSCRRPRRRTGGSCGRRRGRSPSGPKCTRGVASRARRPRRARRSSRRRGRCPARARSPRAQRQRGAVERLGAGGGLLRRAEHGPLLRAARRARRPRRRRRGRAGRPSRGCARGPAWSSAGRRRRARWLSLPRIDSSVNAAPEDTVRVPCRSS